MTIQELKQYVLDMYVKTKDKNLRKVLRKIDKIKKVEVINETNN